MITKYTQIPDEVLLPLMTEHERNNYLKAKWKIVKNWRKRKVVKRIEQDSEQLGKLLGSWAAWIIVYKLGDYQEQ